MSTTLTPRTAEVLLYQGDDLAELDRLKRAAADAKGRASTQTLDDAGWQDLAEQHDALATEAKERAVKVVLRPLGRKEWRALVQAHPPRENHKGDAAAGVDESAFPDALVPPSIIEPTFGSDVEKANFLDSLSDIQFEELYLNAFALNRVRSADPKGGLLSTLTETSRETSN